MNGKHLLSLALGVRGQAQSQACISGVAELFWKKHIVHNLSLFIQYFML